MLACVRACVRTCVRACVCVSFFSFFGQVYIVGFVSSLCRGFCVKFIYRGFCAMFISWGLCHVNVHIAIGFKQMGARACRKPNFATNTRNAGDVTVLMQIQGTAPSK